MLLSIVILKKWFLALHPFSFTLSLHQLVKLHQRQHHSLPTPPLGDTLVWKNPPKFKQLRDGEKLKVIGPFTPKTRGVLGVLIRKQRKELSWRTSEMYRWPCLIDLRFKVPSVFKGKSCPSAPATLFFTRGATESCHFLIETDCEEKDRACLHFLFFYVCSANQDQFYSISFIQGNHLGLHYNKHIGFFPLLKPLLAVLLKIISRADKSPACQQTCSVCPLHPHPAKTWWRLNLNAACPMLVHLLEWFLQEIITDCSKKPTANDQ